MASIGSIEICPRCKSENYHTTDYYKTGEFSNICIACGKNESFHWKREETGRYATSDGSDDYRHENLVAEYQKTDNPFGIYHLELEKGASIGVLPFFEDYQELRSRRREIIADENIKAAFVNFLDADGIAREILKGTPAFWNFSDDDPAGGGSAECADAGAGDESSDLF